MIALLTTNPSNVEVKRMFPFVILALTGIDTITLRSNDTKSCNVWIRFRFPGPMKNNNVD